ncbi:MAG: tetratricopeptide repeat protein [bacterium]
MRSRRQRGTANRLLYLAYAILILTIIPACSSDELTDPPPQTYTETYLTNQGWLFFRAGDFDQALAQFQQALTQDPGFSPALVGRGWTQLRTAESRPGLVDALNSFLAAIALEETDNDVYSGQACVRLALGGIELAGASTDARRVIDSDPDYQFEHWTEFDVNSLYLIKAFAAAGQGDYEQAVASVQDIYPNILEVGSPLTWVVQGVQYGDFISAACALLQYVGGLADS